MPYLRVPALRSTITLTLIALLATALAVVPVDPAAAATPRLQLEHSDRVLAAQLYGFPARRAARIRLDIGERVVIRRVTTTALGRAVARFRVGPVRPVTARVKAQVTTNVRYAAAQYTIPGGWQPAGRTATAVTPTLATAKGPFGPDWQLRPVGDVVVGVGELTQELLDKSPEGTRFVLAAGVHRLSSRLRPRSRQQLIGRPGTIVDGSVVVSDFTRQAGAWVSDGHDAGYSTHGSCRSGYDLCGRSEAVFLDGRPLWQVGSRDQLRSGAFVFDRATGQLVLHDDPRGRRVALTVASAFVAGRRSDGSLAHGVVVRNLVIQRFATMAQRGAVDSEGATGWVIERNRIVQNSGAGVIADSDSVVRSNRITDNGQMGLGGHGNNGLVEGNEIARNHTNGFSVGWEAGGTKWSGTRGLVVRANYVHDNDGPGLWTDIDNIDTRYEDNVVVRNSEAGIFHEISYDAVITGNTVARNGFGNPRWGYGAGIQISASPNVTITANTVTRNARGITLIQQDRGMGDYGPHEVTNTAVHGNRIVMETGFSGLVQDVGDTRFFATSNNRFWNNTYLLGAGVDEPFEWNNGDRSAREWQQFHTSDGPFKRP